MTAKPFAFVPIVHTFFGANDGTDLVGEPRQIGDVEARWSAGKPACRLSAKCRILL
jgi:hypothetical protein